MIDYMFLLVNHSIRLYMVGKCQDINGVFYIWLWKRLIKIFRTAPNNRRTESVAKLVIYRGFLIIHISSLEGTMVEL